MRIFVTIGTSGTKDWVATPDGQKFALGPVSMLSFVSRLSKNARVARKTLDDFLKKGEAMLSVDDDVMWRILAPRRTRWANEGPFMPCDQAAPAPHRRPLDMTQTKLSFDVYSENMKTAKSILDKARATVATINRLASEGKKFNAARARADVAAVTTKVAGICDMTEMTESWIREDLQKLAAWNDKLHVLFHPQKKAG